MPSVYDLFAPQEDTRTARVPRLTPEQAAARLRELGVGAGTPSAAPFAAPTAPRRGLGAVSTTAGRVGGILRGATIPGIASIAVPAVASAVASERSLLKNPSAFFGDLTTAAKDLVGGTPFDLSRFEPNLRRFFGLPTGAPAPSLASRAAQEAAKNRLPPAPVPDAGASLIPLPAPLAPERQAQTAASAPPPGALERFTEEVRARAALGELTPGGRAITSDLAVPQGAGVFVNNSTGRVQSLIAPGPTVDQAAVTPAAPAAPVIDTPYDAAGINSVIRFAVARQQQARADRTADRQALRETSFLNAMLGAQGRTEAATIGADARIKAAEIAADRAARAELARAQQPKIDIQPGTAPNDPGRVVVASPNGVAISRPVIEAPPPGLTLGDIDAQTREAAAAGDDLKAINAARARRGLGPLGAK